MPERIYEENLMMDDPKQRLRLVRLFSDVDGAGEMENFPTVDWEQCSDGDFFDVYGYCFPIRRSDVIAFFHVVREGKNHNGGFMYVHDYYAVIKEY